MKRAQRLGPSARARVRQDGRSARDAHGSTSRAAGLEIADRAGATCLREPHEALAVALRARQARRGEGEDRRPAFARAPTRRPPARRDDRRAAHDAALAHPVAAHLELRLDHRQRIEALGRQQASTAGRTFVSEMNDTSATTRSGA